ncbi:hypothetical protein JL720_3321 [Aureococcus anophagefferens]|nr:hypothetical protein JL720_3321 [Aureococcus anophagefferens]
MMATWRIAGPRPETLPPLHLSFVVDGSTDPENPSHSLLALCRCLGIDAAAPADADLFGCRRYEGEMRASAGASDFSGDREETKEEGALKTYPFEVWVKNGALPRGKRMSIQLEYLEMFGGLGGFSWFRSVGCAVGMSVMYRWTALRDGVVHEGMTSGAGSVMSHLTHFRTCVPETWCDYFGQRRRWYTGGLVGNFVILFSRTYLTCKYYRFCFWPFLFMTYMSGVCFGLGTMTYSIATAATRGRATDGRASSTSIRPSASSDGVNVA